MGQNINDMDQLTRVWQKESVWAFDASTSLTDIITQATKAKSVKKKKSLYRIHHFRFVPRN